MPKTQKHQNAKTQETQKIHKRQKQYKTKIQSAPERERERENNMWSLYTGGLYLQI